MVFATDYPQNFNNTDPKMGKNADGIGEYIETIRKLPLDSENHRRHARRHGGAPVKSAIAFEDA